MRAFNFNPNESDRIAQKFIWAASVVVAVTMAVWVGILINQFLTGE